MTLPAQLAFGGFDRVVDFADSGLDHLGHLGHDWALGDAVDRLLDDAARLPHFLHADEVPVVSVAVLADGNFEIEVSIVGVGDGPANVPLNATSAQHGAGDAEGDGILGGQHADIPGAVDPDAIAGQQCFVLIHLGREE